MGYMVASSRPATYRKLRHCIRGISFLSLVNMYRSAVRLGALLRARRPSLLFLSVRVPCLSKLRLLTSLTRPPRIVVASTCRRCTLGNCRLSIASCLLGPVSFSQFLGTIGGMRNLLRRRG